MNPVELVKADALSCMWDPATYFVLSSEVETLVYYSHLFPAVAALVLVVIISILGYKNLRAKLFVAIAVLFIIFAVFDLVLWATANPSLIMFLWSMLTYIEPLIYALTLYLQ